MQRENLKTNEVKSCKKAVKAVKYRQILERYSCLKNLILKIPLLITLVQLGPIFWTKRQLRIGMRIGCNCNNRRVFLQGFNFPRF